jgi:hypothetical protein
MGSCGLLELGAEACATERETDRRERESCCGVWLGAGPRKESCVVGVPTNNLLGTPLACSVVRPYVVASINGLAEIRSWYVEIIGVIVVSVIVP